MIMITPEITVQELQKMLEAGKDLLILDVRPQEQRDEWKIADSLHVDVYKELGAGNEKAMDDIYLKEGVPVVTVCAAGKTSKIAADLLQKKGYDVFSLKGGMKAWNYAWNTAQLSDNDLTIIQVRRVAKGCISYIIGSQKEAVVIDASLDPIVYIQLAEKNGWHIKYVMDTHTHADYISRTIELAKASGATHLFTENAEVDYPFTPLKDGQEITFGKALLRSLHTPGHTPDSISYLFNGIYLFTGDTVFTHGVGRPDLKADKEQAIQNAEELYRSLEKIRSLKSDLMILPAHTAQTVAFDNKLIADAFSNIRANIELLNLPKKDFVEQTLKRIPPTPPNYLQIAKINRSGAHDGTDPADLEAGANRCAVV